MLGEAALGSLAGLPSLIKWPGGKYRFAHRFLPRVPPHAVYVEPFFGGGSMFFAKPEAILSFLGDVTPKTIRFHVAVRNGALRACRGGVRTSKAALERGTRPGASACAMMAAAGSGYHGGRDYSPAEVARHHGTYGATRLRRLSDYEELLRRAHLTIGDFARTVRLGERKGGREAFYFLDPPWPGVGGYGKHYDKLGGRDGAESDLPPAKVRAVMDRVTGRVWVIYNDHPTVRAAFCGRNGKSGKWRCYHVPMAVADPRGDGTRQQKWLLAANYDVKKHAR